MQIKLGDSVMVTGTATKDAALKFVGKKNSAICTFSLAVGKNKDTTTIFANCKAWWALGEYAAGISKGDHVCVIGHIEEQEYQGKTYKNIVADWMNYIPRNSAGAASPSASPAPDSFMPGGDGFSEVTDDELPF